MELGLEGKVALVAASSKGLGKACATALAAEGARVVMCARDESTLKKAADDVANTTGVEVMAVRADVAQADDIAALFDAAAERFGGIDVLVINSGGPPMIPLDELTDQDWLDAHTLLQLSAARMVRRALPHMRQRKWGRILAIESSSVKQPVPGLHLSNAVRPGVAGFFKSITDELAKDGITLNLVLPGVFLTDRIIDNQTAAAKKFETTLEARLDTLKKNIPSGRFGEPHELGAMVAFLASERASYVTGAVVQVDGGLIRGIL